MEKGERTKKERKKGRKVGRNFLGMEKESLLFAEGKFKKAACLDLLTGTL